MFGTSRDVRRTTGSLAGLALAGEVCAEKDPPEQCNGMAGGRDSACSALFAPTSELLCFFSSELRILLLCGSDLLESFCIPGLWNEADVSHYRWAPLHAPLPQDPFLLFCFPHPALLGATQVPWDGRNCANHPHCLLHPNPDPHLPYPRAARGTGSSAPGSPILPSLPFHRPKPWSHSLFTQRTSPGVQRKPVPRDFRRLPSHSLSLRRSQHPVDASLSRVKCGGTENKVFTKVGQTSEIKHVYSQINSFYLIKGFSCNAGYPSTHLYKGQEIKPS